MEGVEIRIIESTVKHTGDAGVEYIFTIMYRPKENSLETKSYSNRHSFTGDELMTMKFPKSTIEKVKQDLAIGVFTKFYQANLLANEEGK